MFTLPVLVLGGEIFGKVCNYDTVGVEIFPATCGKLPSWIRLIGAEFEWLPFL